MRLRALSIVAAAAALLVCAVVAASDPEEKAVETAASTSNSWTAWLPNTGTSGPASNAGVAFVNSVTMTIATELGDKTFCIAAVMAMRYNRIFVFSGAIGALLVMTVLSVGIGVAVPTLLPKTYTHYAAAALFAYFGYRLMKEAREMKGEGGHEELHETEAELGLSSASSSGASAAGPSSDAASEAEGGSGGGSVASTEGTAVLRGAPASGAATAIVSSSAADIERGVSSSSGGAGAMGLAASELAPGVASSRDDDDPANKGGKPKPSYHRGPGEARHCFWVNLLHLLRKDWGILTQAFGLTFLAEWGDRSQIATIAMSAAQNPVGVCLGAFVGHSFCTGLAVIGGRLLASRISEKTVATLGAVLFWLFAIHSVVVGPDVDE